VLLKAKAVDALWILVQHPRKMMERETLLRAVWSDASVEDANLTVAISHVRKALGENGETTDYIETIPRVGYRFLADVREVCEEPASLVVEKHTVSETVIDEEVFSTATASRRMNAVLLGTLILVVVALSTALYVKRGSRQTAGSGNTTALPVRSLAVLAPKALTAVAEVSSLSLGMADALITLLGGIHQLVVRPTSSIIRYTDGGQDALDIGRALGVDAVLEGSLQRANGRVRITVQLMDVRSGAQLWAGKFDEADADIFKLQDLMSAEIADALALKLTREQRALLTRRPTDNPAAYALYLQGNYFWNKRLGELEKGVPYFQKAIALDPNFARAYVGLANIHAAISAPSPEAEMLIEKALQLDDTLAEAHATRGFIRMFHHWDWVGAEQALDRALALNPNSAAAHHWRGVYLSLRGRLDEAKGEMHRALELDPQSAIITADIGQLHYFAHQYDQSIDYCRRAQALDSEILIPHFYARDSYLAKGMEREAFAEWLRTAYNNRSVAEPKIRAIFARDGFRGVARQQLDYYLGPGAATKPSPWSLAYLSLAAGDKEQALRWLTRGYEEHLFMLPFINVDPLYDPVRQDPRFQDILHRIGLRS